MPRINEPIAGAKHLPVSTMDNARQVQMLRPCGDEFIANQKCHPKPALRARIMACARSATCNLLKISVM
jgi:hypothetical protein